MAMAGTVARQDEAEPAPSAEVRADPRNVALVILATLAVIAALRFAEVVLVPVVLAVLVSYALDPFVQLLERVRVPRGLGATLLVAVVFAGLGGAAYSMREDVAAVVAQLPDVTHRLGELVQSHSRKSTFGKVQQAAREIEKAATAATKPAVPPADGVSRVEVQEPPIKVGDYLVVGSVGAAGLAAQIVVVVFLALYLLAAGDLFKRKLVRIAGPTLTQKKVTLQILQEIDRQIARFMLIRLLISLVVGVATGVGLALVGLHHAVLWGIGAGVLNTIPYIGPAVIAVCAALAGFLQFGTVAMTVVTSGITIVVATFEGYLLTPWLTSRAARMNSVAVFVGLLFFGWLWGVWGMLLAVPIMMVAKAVCDRIEDLHPVGELLGD